MEKTTVMGASGFLGVVSIILMVFCFYFTHSFFQHLKSGEVRLIKQSKIAAVIFLALSLLLPAMYNLYMYHEWMK
ncbi:hypothetical protein [Falsibacillus albus]|uniref:Uncharacterized protein n=1 Tax=Falsibacillus albus TaxID=2478915 RepID=A0A3L7JPA7_9BACI|nr:hypothetical protein [Falsibacillus albus]RLQ92310.1 hypothetical protein D9X91_19750 [Falsibacillus albus]